MSWPTANRVQQTKGGASPFRIRPASQRAAAPVDAATQIQTFRSARTRIDCRVPMGLSVAEVPARTQHRDGMRGHGELEIRDRLRAAAVDPGATRPVETAATARLAGPGGTVRQGATTQVRAMRHEVATRAAVGVPRAVGRVKVTGQPTVQ